jgi:osmoprotectant transport system ATP-binding protein
MIRLENVSKSYGQNAAVVDELNLEINEGEIVVLVGESGCGKTTTMKMINRLIEPTSGDVYVNGQNTKSLNKNDLRRNIGYVIQNVGLLPHLTIEKNIATVPRLCKKDPEAIHRKVHELMDLVELPYDSYATRYPRELSGGQQQRVGVARALANDPDVILMDEPFSALDPITREQLQNELLKLQQELHKTIVFVTHDIDEALKLGDRIAVMSDGKILQYDSPENILKHPVNAFVENFVGKDRLWKTPEMMKAEDVMHKKVVRIAPDRTVLNAIELMRERNTNVLIVVENITSGSGKVLGVVGTNRLKGIIDLGTRVRDIMKTDIMKIPHDMSLTDVLNIRKEKGIAYSPIVDDDGNICGIITNTSIVNVLADIAPEREEY